MSISGKHIAAKIGSMAPVLVPGLQNWSGDYSAEKLDGTTAEDEGFSNPDDGLHSLSVSMELVIDITSGSMVSLKAGTLINDLLLFADIAATTPIFAIPLFKIFKCTPKGEINGRFTYSVQGESKGGFDFNDPN